MPPTLVALKSRPYLEDGALGEPRTMQYGHIVTLLDGTSNYRAVNLDLSLSPFRVECAALPPISDYRPDHGRQRNAYIFRINSSNSVVLEDTLPCLLQAFASAGYAPSPTHTAVLDSHQEKNNTFVLLRSNP